MFEDEMHGCSQPPLIGKIVRMFELIDSMGEKMKKREFFELMEIVGDLLSERERDPDDLMMKA